MSPSIPISDLLQQIRLFVKCLSANLNIHAEIRAHVKGRIDVDELEAARLYNLLAQRSGLE